MDVVQRYYPNYGMGSQYEQSFVQISNTLNAVIDCLEKLQQEQATVSGKIKMMCKAIEQEEEALRGAPLTRAAVVALSVDSIMKD